jgi:lipid-A-disaccharide synthase
MQASDILIMASGTATMEASFLLKPMIIIYKVGLVNFLLGGLLIRTRFIGMPNILARRQVALELLQSEVRSENIVKEALRLLSDETVRHDIISELKYVKNCYGSDDPAGKAGNIIRTFAENLK